MDGSEGPNGSGNGSEASVQTKVKKVKPPYSLKTAIRSALRLVWRQNPVLQLVLKRERIERPYTRKNGTIGLKPRVFYMCHKCHGEFKKDQIQIDHLDPVGPTPGSKLAPPDLTWDAFIDRMFCGAENLTTLCKVCHRLKTNAETAERFRRLRDEV